MKKTRKRILTAILCAILLSSTLVSCADATEEGETIPNNITQNQHDSQKPSGSQSQTGTQSNPDKIETEKPSGTLGESSDNTYQDIELDTYKEQISYYMALTESLKDDLLKLKEETYIDECEYQLQIKTLEQTIQNLNDTISAMTKGESDVNIPSSGSSSSTSDQLSATVDYKYETSNGEVTITEYTGKQLDVKIPSEINGYPVVKIGEGAFRSKQIRSATIPSGVREIDWFAFSGCTVLESVSIPPSVMSVQYGSFDYCPKSLIIKCKKGSYIEAYALSWGMNVETE